MDVPGAGRASPARVACSPRLPRPGPSEPRLARTGASDSPAARPVPDRLPDGLGLVWADARTGAALVSGKAELR
jgi:hypothetical protein